jgi:hypothetical protein
MILTLIGSALGAIFAASALTGISSAEGVSQVVATLSNPNAILASITAHFGPLAFVSLALALYIAFRLSASKPSAD